MIVKETTAHDYLCCGPEGCGILVPASGDAIIPGHVSVRRVCAGAKCMGWIEHLVVDITKPRRDRRKAPATHGFCCYNIARQA